MVLPGSEWVWETIGMLEKTFRGIWSFHLPDVPVDVDPVHQGKIDSNEHIWKRMFSPLKNNGKNP